MAAWSLGGVCNCAAAGTPEVLSLVRVTQVMVVGMMIAHTADMASAVFQHVHRRRRGDLSRARGSLRRRLALTVCTARDAVVLDSQICDLWKEALLSAHRKLLSIHDATVGSYSSNSILVLDDRRVQDNGLTSSSYRPRHRPRCCSSVAPIDHDGITLALLRSLCKEP